MTPSRFAFGDSRSDTFDLEVDDSEGLCQSGTYPIDASEPQAELQKALALCPKRWLRSTVAVAVGLRTPRSVQQWCADLDRIDQHLRTMIPPDPDSLSF